MAAAIKTSARLFFTVQEKVPKTVLEKGMKPFGARLSKRILLKEMFAT
jgi:hypothetical protein